MRKAHRGNDKFKAINQAVAREGWKIVGLTRLSPVFTFNLLNYAFLESRKFCFKDTSSLPGLGLQNSFVCLHWFLSWQFGIERRDELELRQSGHLCSWFGCNGHSDPCVPRIANVRLWKKEFHVERRNAVKIIYYESNGQLNSLATESYSGKLWRICIDRCYHPPNARLTRLARADSGFLHFQLEPLD